MVELRNVSFTYRHRNRPSVNHVSLRIAPGAFVLLTGATGCGKSTLLKMLNGLIPQESGGRFAGEVLVGGQAAHVCSVSQMSRRVGMVFQNPDDQIFSTTVYDEAAFVLENQGINPAEIKPQVMDALQLAGLQDKVNDSIHSLSGGQKQRLAVASVLAARPQVLALDEPISQLDPQGAAELLTVLKRLNTELKITIILVEHRLHEVLPLCDTVVIMDNAQLIWQGRREEAYNRQELFAAHGLRLPQPVTICHRLNVAVQSAAVGDAVASIRRRYQMPGCARVGAAERQDGKKPGLPVAEACNLSFAYDNSTPPVLREVDFQVFPGQFIALMGRNGTGKSTLLHLLGGLLTPTAGKIKVLGQPLTAISPKVGMVLQNPDFMLFNSTVWEEIGFSQQQLSKGAVEWNGYCQLLMDKLGLTGMEEEFPLALSRGQRLRVAIAAVLSCRPQVLLLDEPTTGQDIGHIADIALLLKEYTRQGGSIIFCTHDTEVAAQFADRIVVMCQGQIVADDLPAAVFQNQALLEASGLKPPAALLIARDLYGGVALSVEEVVGHVRQTCMGSCSGENPAS